MSKRTLADRTRSAEARTGALTKHRNVALLERNALLVALSHYWPAYLTKRKAGGPDMILVLRNPTLPADAPALSWLLFRGELKHYAHLTLEPNTADDITQEQRLALLLGHLTDV